MGLYGKMGGATETGGGDYWNEGDYIARIIKHEQRDSNNSKGPFVVIECKIESVLRAVPAKPWGRNTDAATREITMPASNTKGAQVAQIVFFSHFSAMANLKNFIVGASGMDEETIVSMHCQTSGIDAARAGEEAVIGAAFEAMAERVYSGGGGTMFAGNLIYVRAVPIPKKNKDPFTKIFYSAPTPAQLTEAGLAEGGATAAA